MEVMMITVIIIITIVIIVITITDVEETLIISQRPINTF